ncbi:hypothetical protein SCLCIDRAFT_879689 [Scleroderma citrinum Foug A]|uniref:Uncharacterized protein n=1 Tax=Scleroderma citrinum Foug A TaxID=1036808 RepID=A0A0C3EKV4_9AGAM|nr:hypothetical protein SCLCIDRAFT_879689 [Scleroderma citrinum Foug A]
MIFSSSGDLPLTFTMHVVSSLLLPLIYKSTMLATPTCSQRLDRPPTCDGHDHLGSLPCPYHRRAATPTLTTTIISAWRRRQLHRHATTYADAAIPAISVIALYILVAT